MRVQYKFVTAHFDDDAAAPHSLRRHYNALMDELLRQSPSHSLLQRSTQWRPPADIHETPDTILVKLELAGVREEDLTITLYEDALVVTGRRDDDPPSATEVCYHEAQIHYGPFRAEIMLPARVRREGVEARYANGFVRVSLPKLVSGASQSIAESRDLVSRAASGTHPLQAGAPKMWPSPAPVSSSTQPDVPGVLAPAMVSAAVPAERTEPDERSSATNTAVRREREQAISLRGDLRHAW